MITHFFVGLTVCLGVHLRNHDSDIVLETIEVAPITVDTPPMEVEVGADGQTTVIDYSKPVVPPPERYAPNDPSVYSIETEYNQTLSGEQLSLNTTEGDVDMCTYLNVEARVNLGCMGTDNAT